MNTATSAHQREQARSKRAVGLRRVGHRARDDSSATCRRCTSRSIAKATTAGTSSTTETTAPISKFCWPITCL